jgi:hypothetical protein
VAGMTIVVELTTLVTGVVPVDVLKFSITPLSTSAVAVKPAPISLKSWHPPPAVRRKLKAIHPTVPLQASVHSRIEFPAVVPIRFELCLFRDTGPMLIA